MKTITRLTPQQICQYPFICLLSRLKQCQMTDMSFSPTGSLIPENYVYECPQDHRHIRLVLLIILVTDHSYDKENTVFLLWMGQDIILSQGHHPAYMLIHIHIVAGWTGTMWNCMSCSKTYHWYLNSRFLNPWLKNSILFTQPHAYVSLFLNLLLSFYVTDRLCVWSYLDQD